jgi:hypothetical protein
VSEASRNHTLRTAEVDFEPISIYFLLAPKSWSFSPTPGCADRILQMALGSEPEEDGNHADVPTRPRVDAEDAERASLKKGGTFLAKLPKMLRPIAPFVVHPKIPRVARQKALDKLAGQYLALLAHRKGCNDVDNAVNDEDIFTRALQRAREQEQDIYSRCSSGQVYQNLAARANALDWERTVAEQSYKRTLEVEAATHSLNKRLKTEKKDLLQSENEEHHALPPPSNPQRLVLEEADLDWDGRSASMENDSEKQGLRRKLRRNIVDILEKVPGYLALSAEERVVVVDRCTERTLSEHLELDNEDGERIDALPEGSILEAAVLEIAEDILSYRRGFR